MNGNYFFMDVYIFFLHFPFSARLNVFFFNCIVTDFILRFFFVVSLNIQRERVTTCYHLFLWQRRDCSLLYLSVLNAEYIFISSFFISFIHSRIFFNSGLKVYFLGYCFIFCGFFLFFNFFSTIDTC